MRGMLNRTHNKISHISVCMCVYREQELKVYQARRSLEEALMADSLARADCAELLGDFSFLCGIVDGFLPLCNLAHGAFTDNSKGALRRGNVELMCLRSVMF